MSLPDPPPARSSQARAKPWLRKIYAGKMSPGPAPVQIATGLPDSATAPGTPRWKPSFGGSCNRGTDTRRRRAPGRPAEGNPAIRVFPGSLGWLANRDPPVTETVDRCDPPEHPQNTLN